jgi:hypothetical protein
MLPSAYGIPAALALIVGGTLSCFAGYRLFQVVLAIYGFILGAMLASSLVGATSTGAMVGAAIVGGIASALILTLAYFVGIAPSARDSARSSPTRCGSRSAPAIRRRWP